MRGFKLTTQIDDENFTVHDLHLEGGDLVETDGIAAAAQEIKHRLLFFKGESFLDLREGIPYFQEILKKGVDLGRIRAIMRQAVLTVPGIVDVPSLTISLDRVRRRATISFEARFEDGSALSSEDFGPLIIEV